MWVNRPVLAIGVIFFTLPYLILLVFALFGTWSDWWSAEALLGVATISLYLSTITFALLGGYAFAAERADRSAEFLAYLPPSRLAIVASKVVFTVAVGLLLVLVHQVIVRLLAPLLPGAEAVTEVADQPIIPSAAILMFGVAWLCSTIAGGPALAAGCGILASFAATTSMHIMQVILPYETIAQNHDALCFAGGAICFVIGTVYYVYRFET
jgi:ABC-type transport system involved in multi-copper enzyme maturation permease subunit